MKYKESLEAMQRLKRQKELKRVKRIELAVSIFVVIALIGVIFYILNYYDIQIFLTPASINEPFNIYKI